MNPNQLRDTELERHPAFYLLFGFAVCFAGFKVLAYKLLFFGITETGIDFFLFFCNGFNYIEHFAFIPEFLTGLYPADVGAAL